ncbi:MAG TPA: transporter substrate-binding domain-containing protein [Marinobacter sp.]|uniref:substrate-binding periplasmic protein n=1 Tax=Marinobacter sp. TaxID=50741 RepID=UPI002D7E1FC6|nr:transporter substrate-binding domain-containing protein [Marinobacter sp.]HET8802410.1 transporter substrate-binding domain-containing protein [Marinobacter sp.]
MDFRPLAVGMAGLLALSAASAQPSTPQLNLYTFLAPPYQVSESGRHNQSRVTGETVETVHCAASQVGWPTRVRLAPPNRGLHSLRRNLIDGYFAVDSSMELDSLAKRSDPLALEKWYFFSRSRELDPERARIGVVAGSNEEAWLLANDYPVYLSVASSDQLLALLRRGRIDTALMDERVMASLRRASPEGQTLLHAHFLRYAPLHLYLTENFTAKHPKFLGAFNKALPDCMAAQLALSDGESQRVRQLASELMEQLNQTIDLHQALADGLRLDNFTDVLTVDSKWQALAPDIAVPMAQDILGLPGSHALHDWQLTHGGLITEILLINDAGTLAAISNLSSDYWQGDEPKFQEVIKQFGRDAPDTELIYISPIRYDASTARFQVFVSGPVLSADSSEALGVVAMGLDIETLLHNTDIPLP